MRRFECPKFLSFVGQLHKFLKSKLKLVKFGIEELRIEVNKRTGRRVESGINDLLMLKELEALENQN